ncbi:type IV pilus secretin PilQ [Mariprofundus erugo]|uniref:Type IV pilus secretin PilQ n=1 Tax=Mariprofundus erugo TaxID=2528639 RepID=A0A5R9H3V9_9PROT|nr:type IV pilus secretin PilQ [Mariprofundus erugo]TLS74292.1 type IV pilus secretin PilQ [Mariprofundus erugo]
MLTCLLAPQLQAATLQGLNLLADGSRQSLRISLDEPIEYQVFNLEGPARLVLQFPHSSMGPDVVPMKGQGAVEMITPTQDADGVRVEIAMAPGATYAITEKAADLLLTFTPKQVAADQGAGAQLQDIEVRDQGGVTELVLRGQHMDANHNALVTNDGSTMVVDFWGGRSMLPKEYYSYSSQRVNDVTVGAADGRLRLVMNLRAGSGDSHQIDAGNNQMVIRFGAVAAVPKDGAVVVEAVDFQPDDRIAHLVIRTDSANPVINLQEEDGKVVLDLKKARLAPGQERSQDVRAFPGPVEQIDSYAVDRNVRIVTRLRQKSVVSSYQSGNVLTVTMKPQDLVVASRAGNEAVASEKIYNGQKVTFNYKDIDIRNALKLISEMSDFNIIMSDDVKGVLTMRLVDVPWDQALDIILAAKGLGKEQSGNVIRIAPLQVLNDDASARKQAVQSAEDIAPLETEFITLGYASVNDVKTIMEGGSVKTSVTSTAASSATGAATDAGGSSTTTSSELKLLSDRGVIMLDERSNTMIITDTRERLNNIKRLIAVIDKPMQQVMVEARIVEATDTFSRDLGVKWGGTATRAAGNITQTLTGKGLGTNVVDLGAAVGAGSGGAIGYTLGTLNGALNLNLELSAAEQEGQIKVVSSPRVFTSNLQEALIEQEQQIPFLVTTVSAAGTTTASELKSAKLTLKVTPQITADKRIIMQLVVNKDTPVANPVAGGPATIDKKQILTKLLVKNGETVVLGGIYSQTTSDQVNGVPGLQNIPFIGNFFKRKQKVNNRNELLIFITPTIIADDKGSANQGS